MKWVWRPLPLELICVCMKCQRDSTGTKCLLFITHPAGILDRKNCTVDNSKSNKEDSKTMKHGASNPTSSYLWWVGFCCVLSASLGTRFYKIEQPPHVCWDETHFGKMGSYYINRTFFFDVHPPLGKLLIGISGILTGYNGTFKFKQPGEPYGQTSYVGMRMVCACLGSLIPVLCFSTVWHLVNSLSASVLAASLVICDTGTISLSQYILLDPFLLCFIMVATWAHIKFMCERERSFTICWWLWLCCTGIFLATAASVKFVGLFVVAHIGISTVVDLWKLLGDLNNPLSTLCYHLFARVVCLILLPVCIYLAIFFIHLKILNQSGSGDGFFSSAFQSQLKGNTLYNASMPQDVAFGSVVTIKNYRPAGAYLHSHVHLYPEGLGALQQQVTAYWHKDENNLWKIKSWNPEPMKEDIKFLKHRDLLRLEHVQTRRNLHSHQEPGPVTTHHLQVTCYGNNGTGDAHDVFRLNIVNLPRSLNGANTRVKAVTSHFQLIHVGTGCAVHSHNTQLPEWGFEQLEVTCNPNVKDQNTYWNIEEVIDERLENVSFEVFAPSFLEKFVESHIVMFQSNAGLKPRQGEVTSLPWQWPLNYRGQPLSGGDYRIYLLGNPVIWWTCLSSMLLFTIVYSMDKILRKRGILHGATCTSLESCIWLFQGWTFHYIPFWLMSRVLYFHHYFPAFLYSTMLTAIFIDELLSFVCKYFSLSQHFKEAAVVLILALLSYSLHVFSPLCYGMSGHADDPRSSFSQLKWLPTWEF